MAGCGAQAGRIRGRCADAERGAPPQRRQAGRRTWRASHNDLPAWQRERYERFLDALDATTDDLTHRQRSLSSNGSPAGTTYQRAESDPVEGVSHRTPSAPGVGRQLDAGLDAARHATASGESTDEVVMVSDLRYFDAQRVSATLGAIGTPAGRAVEATRPRVIPVHPQHCGRESDAAQMAAPGGQ